MFDRSLIRTYPLKSRPSKVSLSDVKPLASIPGPIDSADFRDLIARIKAAKKAKKPIIFMMGGHAIKQGLSRYIVDLIDKGFITHLATNGAASIHDFEMAFGGETSEDVAARIKDGSFGMAEETGRYINEAINKDAEKGYGFAHGKMIEDRNLPLKEISVSHKCFKKGIPYTVHASIGADIIHQHTVCDGARLGLATYNDFLKFTDTVCHLGGDGSPGGVVLNVGCAVMMPEVFLKALSISRNLGTKNFNITTANFDMIDHYRPRVNVVERPTADGGKGFFFKEKHERSIPSLWMGLC